MVMDNEQPMTVIITVRTTDGVASQHEYVYPDPLSEKDRQNLRGFARFIRGALRESRTTPVRFSNPLSWYRSSHITCITAEIHRGQISMPHEEVRRLGFLQDSET